VTALSRRLASHGFGGHTGRENIMLNTIDTVAADDAALAYGDLALDFLVEDEMDAPSDWDAGTITFDPYVV